MRGTSSAASGSSISRMRGCASSARPIATRCFSPPDKRRRLAAQQRAEPEQVDDAFLLDEALGGRAQTLSVEQVRFHVEVRKEQRVLEHVADAARFRRQVDAVRASNRIASLMRIEPRRGLAMPAIALTTLVLPAPERPNRPDDRRVGARTHREVKRAEPLLDVNVDHRVCDRACGA